MEGKLVERTRREIDKDVCIVYTVVKVIKTSCLANFSGVFQHSFPRSSPPATSGAGLNGIFFQIVSGTIFLNEK
jgi:hypothetical protein